MADDFVPGKTVCIHLIYPNKAGKIRTGKANITGVDPSPGSDGGVFDVACLPGSGMPTHATSEPVAVTCPTCKASAPFADLLKLQEMASMGASEADKEAMKLVMEQRSSRLQELGTQSD
ncbi:MAG: hypothetical protein V4719_29035 [Planctomycetota bacterium]